MFFEQDEPFDVIKAEIPLPSEIHTLRKLFSHFGEKLFAVGGIVRDYMYSKFHNHRFSPKDVDLATSVQPDRVLEILSSPMAKQMGIKPFPKGESFGVISAVLNGEEFEIATFREEWYDPEKGDGRRPDQVNFSTPGRDAQRRDLTMNALFYDIETGEIRDYNLNAEGKGQGLEDIKNMIARPVGNPHERFREDKLRVLRLIRFFSRFNSGDILKNLDNDILQAVEEFRELAGVSPERIAAEFLSGLTKSRHPASYLSNYTALKLWTSVFPGLKIDVSGIAEINDSRNIPAVLAWLLKNNNPQQVRQKLNSLKYPNQIADRVSFLLKLYNFQPEDVGKLLTQRDLYQQLEEPHRQKEQAALQKDVMAFAKIAGNEGHMRHFMQYKPTVRSQDFMHLKGPEIGQAMKQAEAEAYRRSLSE